MKGPVSRGVIAVLGLMSWAPLARPEEAKPPAVTAGPEGLTIQSGDGGFVLRLGAVFQGDARTYLSDDDGLGTNAFVLRRARPIVSGTFARRFDFNLTPDFALGTAVIQDAYLDARFSPSFRLRAGKFKSPVGLELLAWDAALPTIERGLPSDLVPNRDLGAMIHGDIGGVAYYQAALLNGAPDGGSLDADNNDGKDLVGRLTVSPFRKSGSSAARGIAVGVAGTSGDQTASLPALKSVGQLTFFSYLSAVTADGHRSRLSPQASYDFGPLRLIAEWVRSTQRVRKSATETLEPRNSAWQVSGSFVLTGEAPVGGYVTPARSIDPSKGGWGALEIAARYGELRVDDRTFARGYADPAKSARSAKAWGVALDWYLTRNVKYVTSFDHTVFSGGAAGGGDRDSENALFFRAQVAF